MKEIELKEKDVEKMQNLNRKNKWCIKLEDLIKLGKQHKEARKNDDAYKMALIEYRLTDINYHTPVAYLMNGDYEGYFEDVRTF